MKPAAPVTPATPVKAPGPPNYTLLRQLRRVARDPLGFYEKYWRTYGDITRLHWRAEFSAYVCVHPEMVGHILQGNWSNYPKGFFYKRLSVFTGNGLFTSEGDFWLRQRRLAQPAFHRAKIQNFCTVMSRTVSETLDRWDKDTTQPFDVAAEMMKLALQIVGRTLFGADLGGDAERFHALMNVSVFHVEHRFNPTSLPEKVPTPRNRRFLAAKAQIDAWVMSLIRERREKQEPHNDLLQLLLDARDPETGEGMSDRQLMDEALTLLAAGHETTADALAWSFALLAQNPEKREALEAEARTLNGQEPQFEDMARLPYSRMVFEEALRLYPPVWVMTREAKNDDEIAGFPVAARSTIMVPAFLTHRHPEFWPDPEKFEPERFLPEVADTRPRFAYFPFGGGPRLCLGQNYALMEGQIVLSMVAARFRLDLHNGVMPEKHPSLVLRPKGGLWMTKTRL
ncbi:cytochrome P450 [bacterium]|nr:MAG: cytochrome P450 [bacterium]